MQSGINILRHPPCITANKKLCPFGIQPFPDSRCVLEHTGLDINLVGLIPRKGAIKSGQNAIMFELSEILPIGVITFLSLRSEKEPVLALRANRLTLLEKGTKRRDAGARSDHDDWCVRIIREMKMLRRARINRHRRFFRAVSHERGTNSVASSAVTFVADHVNNEMHLIGVGAQA